MRAEAEQKLAGAAEGTIIGDYRVLRHLGGCILGDTYLVEHRFLKRTFVIKCFAPSLSDQTGFIERFEAHVGALAQLEHPHIVKIHNVSFADGLYFLVTDAIVDEHLVSTNLEQYLSNIGKRLDEANLYQILLQLANAFDYAHGAGVIHRGFKLDDVLVRESSSQPEVFVSDFGISAVVGSLQYLTRMYGDVLTAVAQAEADSALLGHDAASIDTTWHSSVLETLTYQAPEQRRAETNISSAVDVYAFGVLAYAIIVGELPEGAFAMPSERVPDYRWNWDGLIKTCLQPDPQRRATSLVTAVKAVQATTQAAQPAPRTADTTHFQSDTTAKATDALQPGLRATGPRIERPEVDLHPEKAFQVDTTVKVYQPAAKTYSEVDPIPTEMVVIPSGTYWRGSNDGKRDETPRHRITLRSYAVDAHPVTNEQFVRFLTAMGGEKDSYHRDLIRLRDSRLKRSGGKLSIESGYHKHPVVGVTWYGAAAYARWVGKRLPTEAEWEIAASGAGGEWPFPTGENIDKSLCNYFSADTTPVTSHPANALGLYDIAGNVYEWCYDWYDYNYYEKALQEPDNPEGPLQGVYRVLRGGCWKSLKEDLRCSRRHRNNPGTVNSTYGFRCASDVDPVTP